METIDSDLLMRHTVVDTRNPDEAEQQIGRIFCPHKLSPDRHADAPFHAIHRSSQHRSYSLNLVSYGRAVDIDPGELSRFFLLQLPLAGSARVTCGKETALVSPGQYASLLSPTLPTTMHWSDGCMKLIVLIDRVCIQHLCAQMVQRDVDVVEFPTAVDCTTASGRLIADQVRLMVKAADANQDRADAYLARLGESLAVLLLTMLRHAYSDYIVDAPQPAGGKAIERARDWIGANVDHGFSVADIAEAIGVGLRSLQEAVQRHNGTTLTQMVETIRLERFRVALQDPNNRHTVTELAFLFGLNHLGRAAAAYRRRYGETPSETLRRAKW
jgi:AraC-like DNA-binding protein